MLTWWQSRTTDRGGDAGGHTLRGERQEEKLKESVKRVQGSSKQRDYETNHYPAEPECVWCGWDTLWQESWVHCPTPSPAHRDQTPAHNRNTLTQKQSVTLAPLRYHDYMMFTLQQPFGLFVVPTLPTSSSYSTGVSEFQYFTEEEQELMPKCAPL